MELIEAYLQKRQTSISNHPFPSMLVAAISTFTDTLNPEINIEVLTIIRNIEIRRNLEHIYSSPYLHPVGYINFGNECRVTMTITFQHIPDVYTFWDHFRDHPFIIKNHCFTGKARILAHSDFIEVEEGIVVELEVVMDEIELKVKNRNIVSFL
jgi:hypothetical protein